MTDLSPAAQAVLDAAMYRTSAGESDDYVRWIAAAALRALADQVAYGHGSSVKKSAIIDEDEVLAIAAELEGGND